MSNTPETDALVRRRYTNDIIDHARRLERQVVQLKRAAEQHALQPGCDYVVVPRELVESYKDALTLLEGWITRYCHSRYRAVHMADLEKKRTILELSSV